MGEDYHNYIQRKKKKRLKKKVREFTKQRKILLKLKREREKEEEIRQLQQQRQIVHTSSNLRLKCIKRTNTMGSLSDINIGDGGELLDIEPTQNPDLDVN